MQNNARFAMSTNRHETEVFQDLANLCISPGYIHAVSFFCFRDNIIGFKDELSSDDIIEQQYSHDRLIRTEISTLLGLMVKAKIEFTIPKPAILQEYLENTDRLLKELHEAMLAPANKIFIDSIKNKKDENPFTKGAFLREAIFYSAESAYDFQYLDFFVKKYQADNEWLIANKGFAIHEVRAIIDAIREIHHQNIYKFSDEMRTKHPDEWTTLGIFSFSIDEIKKIVKLEKDLIGKILYEFTIDGMNEQFVSLGDYNLVNAKPLIQTDKDTYILFHHYSFLEAAYESPFFWFKESDERYFKEIAPKNRGDFTENFSYEVLIKIFGKNHVFKNIDIFDKKRKIGEIDVLVIFADRAIILQAKSKKLTIEARKGNDNALVDDFKRAIQDSYEQGFKCSEFIQDEKYKLTDAFGNEISTRNNFKEIYIFCVVSEHYPALAFQTHEFLKYEKNHVIKPPFVMDIFLLDVIAEMLSNPLYFLSYINKRTSYLKEFLAQSELAILSYHLKVNLYKSDEFSTMMIDDGIASDLDLALLVRKKGIPGKDTPEGILTKFKNTIIGNFLDGIRDIEDDGAIEIGFFLLTLSEETIFELNKGIQKTIELFLQDGKTHDITLGFDDIAAGITIHSNKLPYTEAFEQLKDHCEHRKYKQRADIWFGLCLDPISQKFRFGILSNKAWCYSKDLGQKVVDRLISNNIKVGRNDKCPCGSGKKYKKCCLDEIK